MMALAFKTLLAYLIGSLSGSLLLGKIKKVDIRNMGSGNAGGTNAFRTQGLVFALGVAVLDIGKGMLASGWIPALSPAGSAGLFGMGQISMEQATMACGFAAVLGHCYPVFHGFRGGKGAATTVGALIIIEPYLLIPMLATWLLTLVLSGYVGLATVLAGFSLVPAAIYLGNSNDLLIFCVAIAAFMAFTHRINLQRLAAGTEYRFERIRLFNRFRR